MPFPAQTLKSPASHYHCIDWTSISVGIYLAPDNDYESPSFLSNFPSLSPSAVPFQVNMRRTFLASCLTRPTPSICVPTLSRTALTGWPSRSRSWTPPWRKVGQMLEVSGLKHSKSSIIVQVLSVSCFVAFLPTKCLFFIFHCLFIPFDFLPSSPLSSRPII